MTLNRALAIGFALLLVNSGLVWAFPKASLFYVGNVLLHIALGAALLAGLWLARTDSLRSLRSGAKLTLVVLSFAGALGLLLAKIGAVKANYGIVAVHAAAGFIGAALLWMWLRRDTRRASKLVGAALLVALALPTYAWLRRRYAPPAQDIVVNPLTTPVKMEGEGGGGDSPFFPSAAKTNVGGYIPSDFFMDSKVCGQCHKEIYDQWNSSAHHFSSFNNQFYRKSIEYMQDIAGVKPSKWCAGCHDHAMFFNGRFERPVKEQIDTPQAHAGLGCMSCHAITHVSNSMGNGGFTMEYPALHELATSDNPFIQRVEKYVTETAPAAHRRQFMKPFMKQPEFCSTCHKVHLDVPVNDYRWLRGFNEYDAWQASGVSGHGARSFYYPPKPQACADCHMPLVEAVDPAATDGKVHSHRFPAANTALAYVNGDQEQMQAVEGFLKNNIVSVDIFALSPVTDSTDAPAMRRVASDAPQAATSFAVGEESAGSNTPIVIREVGDIAAPIDRAEAKVRAGDTVKVDVVVRTRTVGHFFPGGTVDSVECWVELKAVDAAGRDLFWSGRVLDDGRGPVDPGAHFFRSVLLDDHGNPINKRNAFQARSLLYARLIPPGAADVSHFRMTVPKDAQGPVKLTAKVNYRKFSHYYTEFSYAGQPDPNDPAAHGLGFDDRRFTFEPRNIPANVSGEIQERIPALPITVLAESEATIGLTAEKPAWKPVVETDDYLRWNDYGIGLLLQGDLKGAEYAFTRVTEAKPDWADGWLNIGRALIQEGQTAEARPFVEKALELGPDLARAQFFYAMIHKTEGRFDEALEWFGKAAESYPQDRVVLNQIARVLFLQRKYAESLETLDQVSLIDPEDLQMHYTRMLAYRGLGEAEKADHEEQLFRRYKADEASQTRTAKIRRLSPEDNNERQPIHEHVSVPLSAGALEAADDDD